MDPTLTVMTPIFNGERFIRRCYHTLSLQTFKDWQWIAVDDGSTDATAELLEAYARQDDRIQVISYKPNRGRGWARTQALHAARGQWVVVWDVDDVYFPDRLERIDAARREGYDFACGYAIVVDNTMRVKGVRGFWEPFEGIPMRSFVHPTLACRLDLSRQIGYEPHLTTFGGIGEDYQMVMVLAAQHRGRYIDDVVMIYQEDAEITLRKTIDSNRVQLLRLGELYRNGVIPLSPGQFRRAIRRYRVKMVALNLFRVAPRLYKLTVPMRTYGERASDWKLAQERLDFLEDMRRRFPEALADGSSVRGDLIQEVSASSPAPADSVSPLHVEH